MMLKIQRILDKRKTRIRLSGELRCEDLGQVRAEIAQGGPRVVLDLEEVDLVDLQGIRFLNAWRAGGMSVLHCSPYIRKWMLCEQAEERKARGN
jgi:hypothetical protein